MRIGGRVQLRPEDRGEAVGAEGPRVGDREIVALLEMIGERQEIVARVAVVRADLLRRLDAVGEFRMGVQIAAEEAARPFKHLKTHLLPSASAIRISLSAARSS